MFGLIHRTLFSLSQELKAPRAIPDEAFRILWVEFKCPLCGKDLDDDKTMANFLVCADSSHGLLRFFTGDGCYFTTNEQVAEELMKKGKRVHTVDPKEFFGNQTVNLE